MRLLGFALLILMACDEKQVLTDGLTGNETIYALLASSSYPVSGTITIKEKSNGGALILTELAGTEGDLLHPVHLHLGALSEPDAAIAALLTPILGKTGRSETNLSFLADESSITYEQLIQLNACIKIHLSDSGPDRDIILAAAAIGSASSVASNGRIGIAVCQ